MWFVIHNLLLTERTLFQYFYDDKNKSVNPFLTMSALGMADKEPWNSYELFNSSCKVNGYRGGQKQNK